MLSRVTTAWVTTGEYTTFNQTQRPTQPVSAMSTVLAMVMAIAMEEFCITAGTVTMTARIMT